MGIKQTKLWLLAKRLRNKAETKSHYKRAKRLAPSDYELYLQNRTVEMMKRNADFSSHAYLINLQNPITYVEKLQWLKLHSDNKKLSKYADKYEVRSYIKEMIGDKYLVPLISINNRDNFTKVREINFDYLPNSFVLKCTHGSHMNIIVKNKNALTKNKIRKIKKQLNKWLRINYAYYVGLELHYSYIKPRILIEKYLNNNEMLFVDYKYFCFGKDIQFIKVIENGGTPNETDTYVDLNFNILPFTMSPFPSNKNIKKPRQLEEMLKLVNEIKGDFPFVRVDLYLAGSEIYFSELTFFPGAGFDIPTPFEYDRILGELIKL